MILTYIRCFLQGKDKDWDLHLPFLGMSIRSTVNRTTGYTANMLMLGREVNMPWDVAFNINTPKAPRDNVSEYVRQTLDQMEEAFSSARQHIKSAQIVQKAGYDKRSTLRHVSFNIGDLVYTINTSNPTGRSRKLQPVLKGPYIISKVLSSSLYVVRGRRRYHVLHHDRLRLCEDRNIPHWVHRARSSVLNQAEEPDITCTLDSSDDNSLDTIGIDWLFNAPHVEDPVNVQPSVEDSPATTNDGEDFGTWQEETQITRSGRKVVVPKHLKEYVR
jgi:hypothetical protein